jgi:NTE family protein
VAVIEKDLSYRALIDRCITVALHKDILHKKHLCDVYLEPPELAAYGLFQISMAKEIIQIGYRYTHSVKQLFHTS